ncbi:MAG: ATP-binding protein [Alphaproteobacteria bacterium]
MPADRATSDIAETLADRSNLLEQQLRERDELLTMAEHAAGIGVWDIDLDSQTVRGTPQFWRVMGLPPTDRAVPIETTRRLRLPEDRERLAEGFQNVLGNHAETFEMEYRIRRPSDGEIRWIFGRGRLIRDTKGRAVRYSGIDIDVTERKAAETALAEMNRELERRVQERTAALEAEIARRIETEAQLRHAQKMETIGQLAGGIAHDFNNLLTVIANALETLEASLPRDQERLRRLAEAAMRGTERAALLTNRLLAFARRQPLKPELIDVNRVILGMRDMLQRTLGRQIALESRLADGLPAVFVDHNGLENAILNLALNARDAMPEGGRLTIATASDAEAADDGSAANGAFAMIELSDTGSGISPEIRERVFEPFFTTKQQGRGTGLGLAQVAGFAKEAGGFCRLDSEVGAGTTVRLYLPAASTDGHPTDFTEEGPSRFPARGSTPREE